MELKIKSKRLDKVLTFSRPGGSYIFVDLNGREGTLGRQICEGGHLGGPALFYDGDDEAQFKKICRNWYRSYVRSNFKELW